MLTMIRRLILDMVAKFTEILGKRFAFRVFTRNHV